jgi:lysyl-tRNA synthetase class 2
MELANGYHELLDGHELETRNRRVLQQRDADGKAPLPMQSRMQSAMHSGLPNCSGCALGFDRLVMAATHSNRIDEVIPFPIERA